MTSRQPNNVSNGLMSQPPLGFNPVIPNRKELAAATPSVDFTKESNTLPDREENDLKPGDKPLPMYTPPGFCANTVYGCCPDGMTARDDENGSNCPRSRPRTTGGLSSLLVFRVINQLFPPRDPRPRVGENPSREPSVGEKYFGSEW